MVFGRYKPYRRSDHFNIIGSSDADDDDNKPDPKGCPLCSAVLYHDSAKDVYWCLNCGWNRPAEYDDDDDKQPNSSSNNNNNKPKLGVADSSTRDVIPNPDEQVGFVSKGTRMEELRQKKQAQEFPGLDDDLRRIVANAKGTIVKTEEYLPTTGDKDTLTADELDKERIFRTGINLMRWAIAKSSSSNTDTKTAFVLLMKIFG